MPICPLNSRKCIGSYHNKLANIIPDQKYQRKTIHHLACHPGDRLKRAHAVLMLQSLLFITNVACNTSACAFPSMAQKKNSSSILPAPRPAAGRQTVISGNQCHYRREGLDLAPSVTKAGDDSLFPLMAQAMPIKSIGNGFKPTVAIVAKPGDRVASHKMRTRAISKRSPAEAVNPTANKIKAQSRRIEEWMINNNLLVPGNGTNHDYALINLCIESLREDPDLLSSLVRRLCKPTGDFCAHREEILSEKIQYIIFNQWLEAAVFKPDLGEFIAHALSNISPDGEEDPASPLVIAQLYSAVEEVLETAYPADADNVLPVQGQQLNRAARRYILDNVVFPAMPTLRFHNETEPFTGMDIGSVEWVFLHAGLRFAEHLGMDDALLSKGELLQFGHSLEEMLSAAVIEPALLFLFDAPAKIFLSRQQTPPVSARAIKNVFHAPNASSIALEAFFETAEEYKLNHNPAVILASALKHYQTRTAFSPDLTQATELFRQQNEDIAAKYAVVDDMLLSQALESLAPEEYKFIASARVALISARFSAFHHLKHQMISRHLSRHSYSIGLLPEVDLLAASVGSDIRIFALRPTRSGYKLDRIDKITERYYELMTDPTTARKDPDYQLEVHADAVNAPVLKNAGDTLQPLIENLVIRHKQRLMNQLHQAGFEETTWEKAQTILLSLIPLYDCITGIIAERREATLPCLMDAFILTPLIGQGTALAARFAQRGTMGGMAALRANLGALTVRGAFKAVLSQSGADILRFAAVPAAQELNRRAMISLGLAAIRAMDPGFELAGIAGARSVKQLVSIAKLLESRLPVWQKIGVWLEQRHPPTIVTPQATPVTTARLAGLDLDLPVVKLGGDKLADQDIYIRVIPETGEVFGKRYTLTSENILQAVPAPLAKRLRNILEQGLSGRGAPGAGKKFAGMLGRKPYTRVTGAHLTAWIENGISPNPTDMRAFIAQRDITFRQWQRYVHPEGTLTAHGRELLQSFEPDSGNRIFNLPPEIQSRILGHIDARTLHNIGEAFPPVSNEHPWRAAVRDQAAVQLELIRKYFFDIWDDWVIGGLLDERRAIAVQKMKHCLINSGTELDLSGLNLRTMPVAYPPRVAKLILRNNRLQMLQGTLPPDLIHLDISDNIFTDMPVFPGEKITIIIAHHNQFKRVSGQLPDSLAKLDLSHNEIVSVELTAHARLTTLDISHNQIMQLPSFEQMRLESLNIEHNSLTALPVIPKTLTILNAAYNQLQGITGFKPENIIFLDLNFNYLTQMPSTWETSRLRHMKVDGNLLVDIPFPLPRLLKVFSGNKNLITQLPLTWPPRLHSLALVDNLISSLGSTTFPHTLRVLNLHQNAITVLTENLPDGIEKIFIAKNKLTVIMTNVPRDLALIDVSHNFITHRPEHLSATVDFINKH